MSSKNNEFVGFLAFAVMTGVRLLAGWAVGIVANDYPWLRTALNVVDIMVASVIAVLMMIRLVARIREKILVRRSRKNGQN